MKYVSFVSVFHQSPHLFSLLLPLQTSCVLVKWHSHVVKIILLVKAYVLSRQQTDCHHPAGKACERCQSYSGTDHTIKGIHLWHTVQSQTQNGPLSRYAGLYFDYTGNHPIPAWVEIGDLKGFSLCNDLSIHCQQNI